MSTEAVTPDTANSSSLPEACGVLGPDGRVDPVAVGDYNAQVEPDKRFASASGVIGPTAVCAACEKRFSTDLARVGRLPAGCHKLGTAAVGPVEEPTPPSTVPLPRPPTA